MCVCLPMDTSRESHDALWPTADSPNSLGLGPSPSTLAPATFFSHIFFSPCLQKLSPKLTLPQVPCPTTSSFTSRRQTHLLLFFFNFIYLFIYLWLCWVFASVRGLSLVEASGGCSSSRCAGLSLSRPLLLRSTGSRGAGSVIVAHGPSCSAACGILPDQGSNPCPLHWQADPQPLRHQGSPHLLLFKI